MYFLSGIKDKLLLRRFENHLKVTDSQELYDIILLMVITTFCIFLYNSGTQFLSPFNGVIKGEV